MRADNALKRTLLLATSIALMAAFAVPADAATSRKAKRAQASAAYPQRGEIACTAAGCVRVPPGCRQIPGRTWSDEPTGYDEIICPRGMPGFRPY